MTFIFGFIGLFMILYHGWFKTIVFGHALKNYTEEEIDKAVAYYNDWVETYCSKAAKMGAREVKIPEYAVRALQSRLDIRFAISISELSGFPLKVRKSFGGINEYRVSVTLR